VPPSARDDLATDEQADAGTGCGRRRTGRAVVQVEEVLDGRVVETRPVIEDPDRDPAARRLARPRSERSSLDRRT
jgi:hypothetical protein